MPGGVCPTKCLLGLRAANISAFGIHKSFSVILCQVSDCTEVVPQELQLQSRIPEPLDSPKHPEFVEESEKLSTFKTWGVQSPNTLCKAGFYYTGTK